MLRDDGGLFCGVRLASKMEWMFLKNTLPLIACVELRIVGAEYEFIPLLIDTG